MLSVQLTTEFQDWLDGLADKRAQIRIVARLRQAEADNLGDWGPVQGGLSEMRIHYGPGYRIYFTRHGLTIYVLLCGGNKASQKRDIKQALKMAKNLEGQKL